MYFTRRLVPATNHERTWVSNSGTGIWGKSEAHQREKRRQQAQEYGWQLKDRGPHGLRLFSRRGLKWTGAEWEAGVDRTRQDHDHGDKSGGRKKTSMRYTNYGDDFLIDKIKPDEIGADVVNMGDLLSDKAADQHRHWGLMAGGPYCVRKWSVSRSECNRKRENTNMRILEWIRGLPAND